MEGHENFVQFTNDTGGLVKIKRPTVIPKYKMLWVELILLKWDDCTVVQHFYFLNIKTANALVIYNEAMKEKQSPLSNVEFNR